jgi:N-acetylglutamate synthase-like GNAT family acetyltransferase
MATERGFPGVFALTNRAADMFEGKLGFSEADQDALPEERREMLAGSGRDSRVFVKDW